MSAICPLYIQQQLPAIKTREKRRLTCLSYEEASWQATILQKGEESGVFANSDTELMVSAFMRDSLSPISPVSSPLSSFSVGQINSLHTLCIEHLTPSSDLRSSTFHPPIIPPSLHKSISIHIDTRHLSKNLFRFPHIHSNTLFHLFHFWSIR